MVANPLSPWPVQINLNEIMAALSTNRGIITSTDKMPPVFHPMSWLDVGNIGFIFQRYHLIPDLSALGNVEIPAIYANSERDSRRQLQRLLGRLGLEGRSIINLANFRRSAATRQYCPSTDQRWKDNFGGWANGALDSQSGQEVLAILNELNRWSYLQ